MSAIAPSSGLASSDLADRFALILDLLRRTAAAKLASNRAVTPLLLLFWGRMNRLSARFASLVARMAAGTLRPPRRKAADPTKQPSIPKASALRLPERFGWMAQLVPETRVCGSQLQYFLSQPEVAALLDAEPRFARMLRPLCRMLAIPPPAAAPPPSKAAQPGDRPATSEDHSEHRATDPVPWRSWPPPGIVKEPAVAGKPNVDKQSEP